MIDLSFTRVPVRLWVTDLAEVEPQALDQVRSTASLPWVESVAVMPDVHFGKGATVGSVIQSRGAVSPAVVGVDIGCGMQAVRTPYRAGQLTDLRKLRHSIERSVPVGFGENRETTERTDELFRECGEMSELGHAFEKKARHQLGSLGGGNHFIEVCVGDDDYVWVMLHSGSRGTGNQLAQRHLEKAKSLVADVAKRFDGYTLPDPELAALLVDTPEYAAYMYDLLWCQRYAKLNRHEMMLRVLKDLSYHMHGEERPASELALERVDCHHNYIEVLGDGTLLTRKGAVSAKAGERGIIPGSMGARSFIVEGLGNAESHCSCSHGAGRRMSRGAARRQYTSGDLAAQTDGVECRKDDAIIDEIPGAYKDVQAVVDAQKDLIKVTTTLKQVLCVKG